MVKLIFKYRENVLIENINNDDGIAEEERMALKNAKAEEELNIYTYDDSNLKILLSESFPAWNVSVIDNKDGSQTILIN